MASSWTKRVVVALLVLGAVVHIGGVLLWLVTGGDFTITETLYFALITVSTVGFSEPPALHNYAGTRQVVAGLIVSGIVALAFFESTMTAMLVEGVIGKVFRRRRMLRRLAKMKDHYVLAGCGRTGKHCLSELAAMKKQVVAIDQDEELLERLSQEQHAGKLVYVVGDATDDHTLLAAGVERAKGLVATLTEDRDNVFVVLSARNLNPGLTIVAKTLDAENEPKLRKAGADKLVSPYQIGGVRLAGALVRPRTVEFLDGIQASNRNYHMEDVEISATSSLAGCTLRDAPIRDRSNALVVGICEADGQFVHNPRPDHILRARAHLIVVGDHESMECVRQLAAGPRGPGAAD
jgi:voltage-gated potassium channel